MQHSEKNSTYKRNAEGLEKSRFPFTFKKINVSSFLYSHSILSCRGFGHLILIIAAVYVGVYVYMRTFYALWVPFFRTKFIWKEIFFQFYFQPFFIVPPSFVHSKCILSLSFDSFSSLLLCAKELTSFYFEKMCCVTLLALTHFLK